jgi:hypothetical protein
MRKDKDIETEEDLIMRNKGLFVALGILSVSLFSPAVYAADYWTGDGGKGKSLAVYELKSNALSPEDQKLTLLVQSYFATTLGKYSAIDAQNMSRWEENMRAVESKDPNGVQDLGEVIPDYNLRGDITRTSFSAFALNIYITIGQDSRARTIASHSGTYTQEEIENKTAVNKASLDLLEQMDVTLTALARAELQQAGSRQTIQGQTALAQGIVAQRSGAAIGAMMSYNLAVEIDPSLMEAANRVSIVAADIRTGNIGEDRRNDSQWRKDWLARLEETERYFDSFFKTFNQPYALVYTPELQYGDTNYRDDTLPVSFTVELLEQSNWTDPVLKTVNTVWQGLNATGRKTAWSFEDWPRNRVSNVGPFSDGSKRLTIVVELVNDQEKVIARQTFEERGRWNFSFNRDMGIQSFTSSGEAAKTITFPLVKLSDLTEDLTLQFTTVNGVPVADASKNGLLMITTRSLYRDATGFDLSGYDKDGFNRAGYNADGYDRDGFNEVGYDRNGYNRSGFDSKGYNKEGYTVDGSLYNTEGYDRNGYNKKGYDRSGYNRSGYKRWSPVSSYFEVLYTFRPGFDNGAAHGFTIGLLGAYGSFSYSRVVSDEPTNHKVTVNEETTYYNVSLGEFVAGYTFDLLLRKKDRSWGLGVPLGFGRNNVKNQFVLETGLQLRFSAFEIRGTYRTIGFKNSSLTLSGGFCFGPQTFQ